MKIPEFLRDIISESPAQVAMASTRKNLQARISGIAATRPVPVWRGVLGVAAMMLLLAAFTFSRTNAAENETEKASGESEEPTSQPSFVEPVEKIRGPVAPVVSPQAPAGNGPVIAVNLRLVELNTDSKLLKDVDQLISKPKDADTKGADIFIAPVINVSSGQPATLNLTRDFTVKEKGKFSVGVVLSITPVVKDGKITYTGECTITDFDGFTKNSDTQSPVFTTKKVLFDGKAVFGKTTWFTFPSRIQKSTISTDTGVFLQNDYTEKTMLVVVSFEQK